MFQTDAYMVNTRMSLLFQLYLANQARPEEKAELLALLADPEHEEEAKELLGEAWNEFVPSKKIFTPETSNQILRNIMESSQTPVVRIERSWNTKRAFAIAAAVFILISSGIWWFSTPVSLPEQKIAVVTKVAPHVKAADAVPGGNKAMLTLADGTQITLDDMSNGKIASQSGISITKAADGQLIYTSSGSNHEERHLAESQINTISTPKGGQYQINLPDGSKVWLNAASTLKFPAIFSGNERKVELNGEAYFEIRPLTNKEGRQPFKVITREGGKNQEVEVLGTHFNINAYGNEKFMKTTLLEGSVKVTNLNISDSDILRPGQQAILKGSQMKIASVDLDEVMAWKHGNFRFNNLRLVDIMKQLERWYDVEVDYAHLPETRYQGFISKNVTLSQVLDMLELTGSLKFRITEMADGKGKKIEINQVNTNTNINVKPN